MIYFITSVAFWLPFLILVLRILQKSGVPVPQNGFSSYICEEKGIYKGEEASMKEAWGVFGLCITFRVLVYIASIAAIAFFTGESEISVEYFLEKWRQWDVSNYIRIATGGYSYWVEDGKFTTLAFFPLTAVFIRVVYTFVRNMELSAMIVSTVCYGIGCMFMYKMVSRDYGRKIAETAVVLISLFPYGLFFGTGMSESVFFAMSALSLYYLRKHNYLMFAVFGIMTALSRMVGVTVIFPALAELFEEYDVIGKIRRKESIAAEIKKLPLIISPILGILIYLLINYNVTGDAFKYLEYQKEVWHQGSVYFGKSITTMWEQATGGSGLVPKFGIWIPDLLSVLAVLVLFNYGVRRHRSMYMMFFAACGYVNMSLSWPLSVARYTSALIPLFIVAAALCEKHRYVKYLIIGISGVLFGIYLTGYLFSKQIL